MLTELQGLQYLLALILFEGVFQEDWINMVFNLVGSVASFFKVRLLAEKAVIDNLVFRCHYRLTTAMFFLFCILCTANNYIGDPMQCVPSNNDDKIVKVMNLYCWITATFTLAEYEDMDLVVGKEVIHRGISTLKEIDDGTKHYQAFYQWVPFFLFLQGLLFFTPHWIWKNWEGGRVKMISSGVRGTLAETQEGHLNTKQQLVQYFIQSMSMNHWYAVGYFLCEVLNFLNVIFNIYLVDIFLGGNFLTFGTDALNLRGNDHYNYAMARVFPRVTKCTFRQFGASGTVEVLDALCVLASNIINEKIFIFLWFWFIILAIISGLSIIYSIAIILSPAIRKFILEHRFKFQAPHGVDLIVAKTKVGDFLLLHLLGQNINTVLFRGILNELSHELSNPYHNGPPEHTEMDSAYPTKEFLAH